MEVMEDAIDATKVKQAGFLRYRFGGLIHGGAYFRNFTVFECFQGNVICCASYDQL